MSITESEYADLLNRKIRRGQNSVLQQAEELEARLEKLVKNAKPQRHGGAEASHHVERRPRSFSVELPLPPKEASPNARVHWGAKARAVRLYRETCGTLARMKIGRRRLERVRIDLDFYLCRGRDTASYFPRDCDNAISSAKAAIDGLRDIGIVVNDSKKFVTIGETRLHTTKKEHQGKTCLVLTITEIGEGD